MNLVNSKLHVVEEESATASVRKDLEKPDLSAAEFQKLLKEERERASEKNSSSKH